MSLIWSLTLCFSSMLVHYEDASRKEAEQRDLLNMKNMTIPNSVSVSFNAFI